MLAVVDDRVGAKVVANPEVECEIAVRWNQCRIVIGRFRINVVTARRLDGDGGIAIDADREMKGIIREEGIARRITPAGGDLCADGFGERSEMPKIVNELERWTILRNGGVCRSSLKMLDVAVAG